MTGSDAIQFWKKGWNEDLQVDEHSEGKETVFMKSQAVSPSTSTPPHVLMTAMTEE
jgi:hypothetical protein